MFAMSNNALFTGLIFDEQDQVVEVAHVGGEAHYVVNDAGFRRHVSAEEIDRAVAALFIEQLHNNRDEAVKQMLNMSGQDDIFTKAALSAQIDKVKIDDIVGQVLPPQARDMLGMMGFRIILNYRGEIVRIAQPSVALDEEDREE